MGWWHKEDTRNQVAGVQVSKKYYGEALPRLWGTRRCYGFLLDSVNYREVAVAKGGKGGSTNTTGDRQYKVDIDLGLVEGAVSSIGTQWFDKKSGSAKKSTSWLGFVSEDEYEWQESFKFTETQDIAWSYLQAKYPSHLLSYPGIFRLVGELTTINGQMPNMSWELVSSAAYSPSTGLLDCDPAVIVTSVVTDLMGANYVADLTGFSNYCIATGLLQSCLLETVVEGRDFLSKCLEAANSEAIWSQGKVKIIPYGDTSTTGNGITFTPNNTPLYSLTDDDFLDRTNPVSVQRKGQAESFNHSRIQFTNRVADYNIDIAEAKDQANIAMFGLRTAEVEDFSSFIADPNVARALAEIRKNRMLYVRNNYKFKLGWKYALLEPMDLVAITDSVLGYSAYVVRITEIQEEEDGSFSITAEDACLGSNNSPAYPVSSTSSGLRNYNFTPGETNRAVIFEPLNTLTATGSYEIWMGLSGASENWSGCYVYMSLDNMQYTLIGTHRKPCRTGRLTGAVSESATELLVSLAEVPSDVGYLLPANELDYAANATLCYVDGEFMVYRDAVMDSSGSYRLTGLKRGLYDTTSQNHGIGTEFVRVDESIFKYPITSDLVGKTLYFKFVSFNSFGSSQLLSNVAPKKYEVSGNGLNYDPGNVTGLTTSIEGDTVLIRWTVVSDIRQGIYYEVRRGDEFETAPVVGNTYLPEFITVGDGLYHVTARYGTGQSTIPATLSVAGSWGYLYELSAYDEDSLGWPGDKTNVTINPNGALETVLAQGGLDSEPIVDIIPLFDAIGGRVASVAYYTQPLTNVVTFLEADTALLSAEVNYYLYSVNDIFSKIPLVSAVSNVAGNTLKNSRYGLVTPEIQIDSGNWVPFYPGKHSFQTARIRLKIESYAWDMGLVVENFRVRCGLIQKLENLRNQTIPAAGLSYSYDQYFHTVPNIQATIINGTTGDTVTIAAIDADSVDLYIEDSTSTPVERTANITIIGF